MHLRQEHKEPSLFKSGTLPKKSAGRPLCQATLLGRPGKRREKPALSSPRTGRAACRAAPGTVCDSAVKNRPTAPFVHQDKGPGSKPLPHPQGGFRRVHPYTSSTCRQKSRTKVRQAVKEFARQACLCLSSRFQRQEERSLCLEADVLEQGLVPERTSRSLEAQEHGTPRTKPSRSNVSRQQSQAARDVS